LNFFQPFAPIDNREIELSLLEIGLLNQAKKLSKDDLRKLVAQTKALTDFYQSEFESNICFILTALGLLWMQLSR